MLRLKKLWIMFFLGFSSGLPFLLILATLSVWLTESSVSKTQIGILSWVTISYSLKFFLAQFINKLKIPYLYSRLGHYRSWLLISQLALIMAIAALGSTDPNNNNIYTIAICAFMVGFFSAVQDIIVEAYRIESLNKELFATGSMASVIGYRIGMLCSGAGAMYLAAYFKSWSIAYYIMAACMLIGVITTLIANEPGSINIPSDNLHKQQITKWFHLFINKQEWFLVLLFILCYKFTDTVLNVMSMPFLIELGFTKVEIANVAKAFGITAMIAGGATGGSLLLRYNLQQILLVTTTLQLLASALFIVQACIGHNLSILFVTMGIENFTCGLAQIVLITYFSRLCIKPYTVIHYAFLTSFASLARINFSMLAGWLADQVNWNLFYSIVCLSCIPTIVIVMCCTKHFAKET